MNLYYDLGLSHAEEFRDIFSPLSLSPALWLKADAGLVTDGAAQFTAANSEYLSCVNNSTLQAGNIDFWWAGWVRMDTKAARQGYISKESSGGQENYNFDYSSATDRFRAYLTVGTIFKVATANTFGSPSTATWYFICAYHDSANDVVAISINGGAFDTATTSGGTPDTGTGPLALGRVESNDADYADGRLDSFAFGKSPVGGIAALATAIRDSLYNSGSGKTYNDLSAAEKTNWGLVSFWNLNELSGTRNDAHGTNHLTDNNTVTFAAGVASGSATADGDPVTTWQDQSGNGRHATQATASKRPTLKLAIQNGRNVVQLDGVDDLLACAGSVDFKHAFVVARYGGATFSGFPGLISGATGAAGVVLVGDSGLATWFNDAATTLYRKDGVDYAEASMAGPMNAYASMNLSLSSGWSLIPQLGQDRDLASRFWTGQIAEVILFASVLSASQRSQVENYLRSRWGTP